MNLEVGKKYKTRNGSIVEIVAIRPELKSHQVAGIMNEQLETWYIDGSYMKEYGANLDLVAEYKEAQGIDVWVNIYKRVIEVYLTEQDAKSNQWSSCLACKKITIEYTEGEGL
jgi:hypothetical protein